MIILLVLCEAIKRLYSLTLPITCDLWEQWNTSQMGVFLCWILSSFSFGTTLIQACIKYFMVLRSDISWRGFPANQLASYLPQNTCFCAHNTDVGVQLTFWSMLTSADCGRFRNLKLFFNHLQDMNIDGKIRIDDSSLFLYQKVTFLDSLSSV